MGTTAILTTGAAIAALMPFSANAQDSGAELLKPVTIVAGTTGAAPPSAGQVK